MYVCVHVSSECDRDVTAVCGNIPIVLCGNKVEVKNRKIKRKQITYHQKKTIPYFEMSVKADYNLEKPLLWLARELLGAQGEVVFVREPAGLLLAPPVVQWYDEETIHRQERELQHAQSVPFYGSEGGGDDNEVYLECEYRRWWRLNNFVRFLHTGYHSNYIVYPVHRLVLCSLITYIHTYCTYTHSTCKQSF